MLVGIYTVLTRAVEGQIIIHILFSFNVVFLLNANIGKVGKNQRAIHVPELLEAISFFKKLHCFL